MNREDALDVVVEVLVDNGMGHFSAIGVAGQVVDAIRECW